MPTNRTASSLVAAGFVTLGLLAAPAPHHTSPLAAQELAYDGAAATGLALRRLGTTARVLHIGAHPDDENTALFAPLALGRGIDVAYLSLTRGEGGQNGIGPELGVALGVIRTEELLAARRLDGGDQFFARAIDYGYSKNAEEAFRHWPRDSLLADVVAVIRRYRPDVVASVWSGTPRDGHGQHQASGIIAREAVLAAGDPTRFPEQIAAGLRPHTTELYYRSAWFGEGEPDVEINTGRLDPLLGRSYHQIAMSSRSRHRSQDQGGAEPAGPRRTALDRVDPSAPVTVSRSRRFGRYLEGAPTGTTSLFPGVDTLLSQRAQRVANAASSPAPYRRIAGTLQRYEALVDSTRAAFNPLQATELVPPLTRARAMLLEVDATLERTAPAPAAAAAVADFRFRLRDEMEDIAAALRRAANVQVDVVSEEERVVPGQSFQLELSVWNGGGRPVRADLRPLLPEGWEARRTEGPAAATVAAGERLVTAYRVNVPSDARLTMPYYLDPGDPPPEDMYRWPADYDVRGLPFAPAPVRGWFEIAIGGAPPVSLTEDAEWVGVDRRLGELRRPIKVVPRVSVALSPDLAVLPTGGTQEALELTARLRSQASSVQGELSLRLPAGWSAQPRRVPITLSGEGEQTTATFRVRAPAGLDAGQYEVAAVLETPDGAGLLGYDVVDYPHIAPHHLYEVARTRIRALDVRVADVRVGYVAGSGDGIPAALDQLDVPWERLDTSDLAGGDFSRFDVVITGTRAYEVRDDLVANNQQLLEWVRNGGTLIVQYNKYPALGRDYAPWPVTISRPHGRVTDETAPVRVLEPEHPIFTTPNRIGPGDWRGWVQERGLYFWESWEGPLTPLLAMSDPGEEPLTGSLLVAPLGDGTYVYTALALFRQLPAGVPGAYRLLANLISLGAR